MITFDYIWGKGMKEPIEKKNVTLYLNSDLYEKYVEYCRKEGLALSRQIEKFIEKELDNGTSKK